MKNLAYLFKCNVFRKNNILYGIFLLSKFRKEEREMHRCVYVHSMFVKWLKSKTFFLYWVVSNLNGLIILCNFIVLYLLSSTVIINICYTQMRRYGMLATETTTTYSQAFKCFCQLTCIYTFILRYNLTNI